MANKQYTSDLMAAEWQVIEKKLPEQVVARKREYCLHILFNAMLYVAKNACI